MHSFSLNVSGEGRISYMSVKLKVVFKEIFNCFAIKKLFSTMAFSGTNPTIVSYNAVVENIFATPRVGSL
jgi:hypothetical protein